MDTLQILHTLRKFKCIAKENLAVLACDQLPMSELKRPAFFVVNTEPHTSGGRHWVAIYVPRKGNIEFFDSFGKKPRNKFFTSFLKKHSDGKKYVYNLQRLQSDFSATCGHYSVMYLRARCKKQKLKTFTRQFSATNFRANDKKIVKMFARFVPSFDEKDKQHALQYGGRQFCNQTCRARRKKYKKKDPERVLNE